MARLSGQVTESAQRLSEFGLSSYGVLHCAYDVIHRSYLWCVHDEPSDVSKSHRRCENRLHSRIKYDAVSLLRYC